ncbi:hypothetical protein W97_03007 [Coniosporium apollinis CBS 100218]|uniref:Uncharacterized protein n=1 Tax=Coniosporium apollinis (strain CBS 100218) TaxID=1168221 RepID=R7YPN1_CONA1|nr:uncharacterized protein W97_03007 [Coniosporium apollinis CBS 100218]EON63779.1 hypothetical protein W97_03007 [Coniosporium apollinis CBS 100218]
MSSPKHLTDKLSTAVKAGDLYLINSLYTQLASPRSSLDEIAQQAAQHAQPLILEWCFHQGLTLPTDSMNNPFYHAAISSRCPLIFSVLLHHGFDLNAHWSEYLGDALVVACMHGDTPFLRFLLDKGQDPNLGRGCGEYEALTWAIVGDELDQATRMEVVGLMLEHGARLEGTGAAIAAAETGNLQVLEMLLERGGPELLEEKAIWWGVNGRESIDSEGTPLYRACRAGQKEAVEFLLARGADGRSRDRIGRSCLDVARAGRYDNVVKLLKDRGLQE